MSNYLLYGNFPYNLFLNPNISIITATFSVIFNEKNGYSKNIFKLTYARTLRRSKLIIPIQDIKATTVDGSGTVVFCVSKKLAISSPMI